MNNKNNNIGLKIIPSTPTGGGLSFRINAIKELLNGTKLEPIIDFDNTETEAFVDTSKPCDIRNIVNKKVLDFKKIITQLGGRLMYIKSGTTGHTFKGIMLENSTNKMEYAVKVVPYPKKKNYGNLYDSKRPENAELVMLKMLSYFVMNQQTPHIILPIGTFNTNISTFVMLTNQKNRVVNNKKYDMFVKKYKKGEYYPEVSILINEWANGGDLLEHVRKNYTTMKIKEWRVIFFQLIITLAFIQSKYPGFRHNDLKANNILIQNVTGGTQKGNSKHNRFIYIINGIQYIIPNIGIQIKLWDFDFACIPGIVNNSKVEEEWTSKINVSPEKNRYYDLHYFFNTLISKGFLPQFLEAPEVPKKVKEFVNRVVPIEFREGKSVNERGRILINDEYLIPEELLKTDSFFSRYRNGRNKTGGRRIPRNIPNNDIKTSNKISSKPLKKMSRKTSRKTSRKSNK